MQKVILLKRTALGIYTSEVTLVSTANGSIIRTKYGLIEGSKVTHTVSGGQKEFDSAINRKRREGYKSNIDLGIPYTHIDDLIMLEVNALLPKYNTDLDNYSKPMKCQKFIVGKFVYPCLGQPKINGVRATIRWGMKADGLFSAEGVIIKSHEGVIYNIKHIERVFEAIFTGNRTKCSKDIIFDGEVYKYGEHVTSISGAARNPNNPIHKDLQFQCFDLAIPDVVQIDRISQRDAIFEPMYYPGLLHKQTEIGNHKVKAVVVNVITTTVNSDEDASQLREECLNAGYEGCVIRNMEASYKFGSRPVTMMKLKKFKYGSFKVIDIVPFGFDSTSSNDVGKGCKFILKNDLTDDTFECNAMGKVSEKILMIKHKAKYIGKEVTVKYYERTKTNLPFHANVTIDKLL